MDQEIKKAQILKRESQCVCQCQCQCVCVCACVRACVCESENRATVSSNYVQSVNMVPVKIHLLLSVTAKSTGE